MVSKSNSLIIIIPAFNEEKIIKKTVTAVFKEIRILKTKTFLLVVDDGSSDQTYKILSKISQKNKKLKIIMHKKNKGYGAAINTGIKYANKLNFSYALFMDSDLTNHPKDIKRFEKQIIHNFDCVKASRYIKGGNVINVPKKRIYISRVGNLIASFLFNVGVKDCTNGFLMLKPSIFKNDQLKEKGFAVIMEEMYYLKKGDSKIKEIPITLENRISGKTNFKYSAQTFYNYIKYPIKSLWL